MPSGRIRLVIFSILLVFIMIPTTFAEDTVYTVRPGDTLFRISQQHGVSLDAIAQANQISNTWTIFSGQQLVIPDLSEAVENPLVAGDPIRHTVQSGETLGTIANQYGLTLSQISQLNNIANPNLIKRGQVLTVFATSESADETAVESIEDMSAATEAEAEVINGTPYVVQAGEHLVDIAMRFNVSWPAIVQANNISDPNRITVGQTIIIPDSGSISDLGIVSPLIAGPGATITTGKQIIVDLSDSRIYAYEDGRLVHSVLASMGLPATPTVRGEFKVQRKYESQLMSGPGYYLPNVQWIMYFYAGYAIHGAYWHNNWGQPMSHGCVNLPNEEALWFYEWTPTGTPVLVQA